MVPVSFALEQTALATGVTLVDLELPGAVERLPRGSLQLRPRVLGPWNIRRRGVQKRGELISPGEESGELRGQLGGLSGH